MNCYINLDLIKLIIIIIIYVIVMIVKMMIKYSVKINNIKNNNQHNNFKNINKKNKTTIMMMMIIYLNRFNLQMKMKKKRIDIKFINKNYKNQKSMKEFLYSYNLSLLPFLINSFNIFNNPFFIYL